MKTICLVILLNLTILSPRLFAQNEKMFGGLNMGHEEFVQSLPQLELTKFTYVKDIEWQGKTYQAYRTQYDDTVLVGQSQVQGQINQLETKEQEKERTDKKGVVLPWMKKARTALGAEALFSFGAVLNFGLKKWNSGKVAEHRLKNTASLAADGWKVRDEGASYSEDLQTESYQIKIAFRPSFYRHVRLSLDGENFGNNDPSASTSHGQGGFVITADHDLLVFAKEGGYSYVAIAAGYHASYNVMNYQLIRNLPRQSTEAQTLETPFKDHGYTVSFRRVHVYVPSEKAKRRGPSHTLQILGEWGVNGGRRVQAMYLIGF